MSISDFLFRDFINQYRLHRQGTWELEKVRDALNALGREGNSLPNHVGCFANKLGECLPLRAGMNNKTEQHSAASKFAFFSQPKAKHHILDSIVLTALQARRCGNRVPTNYPEFHPIAAFEYHNEPVDFDQAFKEYAVKQSLDPNFGVDPDFHCRYFFDKFLLAQGAFVQAELDRRKAMPSPDLVSRRKPTKNAGTANPHSEA